MAGFGTDQVLLYNVDPWARLGFGVASFGENTHTVNRHAWHLAEEIGKGQLYLMTHVDAGRLAPPSRNTVERLGTLLNRIKAILDGRATEYNQLRVEPGHGSPAPKPWPIHPAPYFGSPIVRNSWLMEFNEYCMLALTNLYQHSGNDLALTIPQPMAADIWRYFGMIQRQLAIELLNLPKEQVEAPGFQFTAEHYGAYDPGPQTVRYEDLDRPVQSLHRFTEDDVRPLFDGIPANLIVANLALYPVGADAAPGPQQAPTATPPASAPGTGDGSAIRPTI